MANKLEVGNKNEGWTHNTVVVITQANKHTLDNLRRRKSFLPNSRIGFTDEGHIILTSLRSFNPDNYNENIHVRVSPTDPRVDPFADRTRYKNWLLEVVSDVPDIETAYRMIEHIRTGTQKEIGRIKLAESRSVGIEEIFAHNFFDLSELDLAELSRKTYEVVNAIANDPNRVVNKDNQLIIERMMAAGSGRDRLGRWNPTVSKQRVRGAINDINRRLVVLDHTGTKYERLKKILLLERAAERGAFEATARRLGDKRGITASVLFRKDPNQMSPMDIWHQSANIYFLLESLGSTLVEVARLNPYRREARAATQKIEEARADLREVISLFEHGQSLEAVDYWKMNRPAVYKLLNKQIAEDFLITTLKANRDINSTTSGV